MRRIRLRLALLTMALSLLTLPAFAGGRGAAPGKIPGGFDRVCQALVRLVPALAEGGTIDPNGGDGSGTATAGRNPTAQGTAVLRLIRMAAIRAAEPGDILP